MTSKAYLKELEKDGEKKKLTYLDVRKSHDGYPRIMLEYSVPGSVHIVKWAGMPATGITLGIDAIEMLAAYAKGVKRRINKQEKELHRSIRKFA